MMAMASKGHLESLNQNGLSQAKIANALLHANTATNAEELGDEGNFVARLDLNA